MNDTPAPAPLPRERSSRMAPRTLKWEPTLEPFLQGLVLECPDPSAPDFRERMEEWVAVAAAFARVWQGNPAHVYRLNLAKQRAGRYLAEADRVIRQKVVRTYRPKYGRRAVPREHWVAVSWEPVPEGEE